MNLNKRLVSEHVSSDSIITYLKKYVIFKIKKFMNFWNNMLAALANC